MTRRLSNRKIVEQNSQKQHITGTQRKKASTKVAKILNSVMLKTAKSRQQHLESTSYSNGTTQVLGVVAYARSENNIADAQNILTRLHSCNSLEPFQSYVEQQTRGISVPKPKCCKLGFSSATLDFSKLGNLRQLSSHLVFLLHDRLKLRLERVTLILSIAKLACDLMVP
eukprot:m.353350 g.353350  ORF g.353350 m.353350 type:complete len:170 (-) comp16743_c0_seq1:732-1241(-)